MLKTSEHPVCYVNDNVRACKETPYCGTFIYFIFTSPAEGDLGMVMINVRPSVRATVHYTILSNV